MLSFKSTDNICKFYIRVLQNGGLEKLCSLKFSVYPRYECIYKLKQDKCKFITTDVVTFKLAMLTCVLNNTDCETFALLVRMFHWKWNCGWDV